MSNVEVTKDSLTALLNALVDNVTAERAQSEPYKELFKAGSTFTGLLHETEHQSTKVILDASDVLKAKGYRTTNESFEFLLALPYLSFKLEQYIQKTEGNACCVDKAFYLLSEELKRLVVKT